MITVIKDIDLYDHVSEYDCTLIGTSTYCTMGQGIQLKVMLNYPYVFEANMKTKYADPEKLGTILECKSEGEPTFCLCFITDSYGFRPDLQKDYLSYESLRKCLTLINVLYKGKKVACPVLGWVKFEGNGDKDKIMEIFNETITDVDLTIYDYQQKSRQDSVREVYFKEQEVKKKDWRKYYDMVRERKIEAEKRFKKNGHRRY